jgi:hypothetical protein
MYEYNITKWENRKLNFWGIPKCANTSIKYCLLENKHKKDSLNKDRSIFYVKSSKWLHDRSISNYISKEDALSNGFKNFSVIRNPFHRFESMYKYNIRAKIYKEALSVDILLNIIELLNENVNMNFKTQYSFVSKDDKIIPILFKIENIEEIEQFLNSKLQILNKSYIENIEFSKSQISRIEKIFQKDFELYESK